MTTNRDKHARDIVIRPIVSEKSYGLIDHGKYTFEVARGVNKTEIKHAVEEIFGVEVERVNTLNRQGKRTRTRKGFGQRRNTKRAIVTLRSGTIDIFQASI